MRRLPLLLLAALLGLTTLACSSSDDSGDDEAATATEDAVDEATTTTEAGVDPIDTHEVAEARHTWVDTTRPTAAHGGQPELPERTLDVVVYAPEGDGGPWPLVVFGHGSSRAGDHYEGTLTAWASAGYVVVAPDHPLTSEGTPGGSKLDDVEQQAGDVSFLIDTALDELDAVDPERIGIGGQSLGAITALGAGFNACCADPRVDVVTEFAGIWFPLSSDGEQDPATTDRPLLMVHGGADDSLTSIDTALEAWETTIDAPGGFITLVGAEHDDGYYEGPVDPWGTVATEAALAFYDAHLKDDPSGWDRVVAVVEEAGPDVATLQQR